MTESIAIFVCEKISNLYTCTIFFLRFKGMLNIMYTGNKIDFEKLNWKVRLMFWISIDTHKCWIWA